jgi:hypothetical protein
MDLPVVPGDDLFGACGLDGQNADAVPLLPFFVFIKVSACSPEAKNSFHYVLNSAPFDVFMLIISFTVSPARSLETMTTFVTSCRFMFAGMCLFVNV